MPSGISGDVWFISKNGVSPVDVAEEVSTLAICATLGIFLVNVTIADVLSFWGNTFEFCNRLSFSPHTVVVFRNCLWPDGYGSTIKREP